jgi:hypothetical protein
MGPASRLALSVGLGFLYLKHVKLPPAPAPARRRILMFEPDRFFPVQDQALAVSLINESDFAFAVEADLIERWTAAFEEWAPVDSVEPAPLSLARALGRKATGSFVLDAQPDEHGLVELDAGRVRSARRAPAEAGPADTGVVKSADAFLVATGAARGTLGSLDSMLLTDARARRVRARRLQRIALAAGLSALALGAAIWSVDRSRDRLLVQVRAEIAALSPRAKDAIELQARLASLVEESTAIHRLASQRPDPLRVLAALSQRLPAGVTVLSMKATGDDWQIDGTAPDAAAIVPLLDGDDRFEGVRFLSASARYREGPRTYETFSIAFRVRPKA